LTTLLQATTAAVFAAAGAHRGVLRALAGTWQTFPLDAAPRSSWRLGELAALGAQWVARSLESALSLSASALLALLVTEVALAAVARVSRPVARAGIDLPLRMTVPLVLVALALVGVTEAARPLLHAALGAVRGG
jgi:type III secretory pathway component EscT